MENLVRIKLDPHRGAANTDDFLRARFRLASWPSELVEIWTSDDDGLNWQKLTDPDILSCFDAPLNVLYVELLFDIEDPLLLAFFSPSGEIIGVGYELTRYDRVYVGWIIEGVDPKPIPIGWQTGSEHKSLIGAGYPIRGGSLINHPVGHLIKCPATSNAPANFYIANPHDGRIKIGFGLGTGESRYACVGASIMGLTETAVDLLLLDDAALDALCTEVAVHKQKQVTLNGTTPEELD